MSFVAATGAPIVRGEYSFPMLKRKHLGVLLASWRDVGRQQLKRQLDEATATPAQRLEEIKAFDDKAGSITYGYRCLYDFGRVDETLLASLRLANPTATEDDAENIALDDGTKFEIAAELWGLKLEKDKQLVALMAAWPQVRFDVRDQILELASNPDSQVPKDKPSAGPLESPTIGT